MPSTGPSGGRLAIVVLLALAAIAAPLWLPAVHIGDPAVTFERAEVVADGDRITYAGDLSITEYPIGDEIACMRPQEDYRLCAAEAAVRSNATVPAGWTRGSDPPIVEDRGRYDFVQLDDGIYRVSLRPNESVRDETGRFRVELGLERLPAQDVLNLIADNTTFGYDAPGVVDRALNQGSATAKTDAAAPATVYEHDGRYYRVYRAESKGPHFTSVVLEPLLVTTLPVFGFGMLLVAGRLRRGRTAATVEGPES